MTFFTIALKLRFMNGLQFSQFFVEVINCFGGNRTFSTAGARINNRRGCETGAGLLETGA